MVFLQHCIVPRVMFSPADALYCCKFLEQLHFMEAPLFSSLVFLDKVLKLLVHRVSVSRSPGPPCPGFPPPADLPSLP